MKNEKEKEKEKTPTYPGIKKTFLRTSNYY